MKKMYETPEVEVVKFQYRDQVVAASGCGVAYINIGPHGAYCPPNEQVPYEILN